MEKQDKSKKQVPLRLSPSLYEKLAAWADDDFRSVNGQIEYLLTECVKKRYGEGSPRAQGKKGKD
ncbi:MAG: hypothetical protein EOM51_03655 [Clostridia bacterium]|nr:hypothetical protein [Clostridia bacterium]